MPYGQLSQGGTSMKRKIFLGISVALMMFAFCGAVAAKPENGAETVVAKVENEVITQRDIDILIDSLDPQMAAVYRSPEARGALIEELINSRLFVVKGIEEGVDKSPEYIDEIERFKKHILMRVTIDKMLEKVIVEDSEAKKFYDENPSQFSQPEQVHAKHILVSDEAEMEKVLADMRDGTTFEEAAEKYSACPSKANGGDLGFFGKGQMVPEFEKAAFETDVGEISGPVKTQFGVHIIKVEAKTPESTVPYEEVADQLKAYLLNQKRAEAYQAEHMQLREKHNIERTVPASE